MSSSQKIRKLKAQLKVLYYKKRSRLLFHGWHHICFVSTKAVEFTESIGANLFLVESAAMVHDLNYIVKPNSEPEVGYRLRTKMLISAGYTTKERDRIEQTVMESHVRTRTKKISQEGKALSDGDTLFKALPITPILFASKFITENEMDIGQLARKVIAEQKTLFESGIYFYTPLAKKKYLKWAKTNLALWGHVNEALADKDVSALLSTAKALRVL